MEILLIESNILKWEQLTDDFAYPIKDGEKHRYNLSPYHPNLKSLFVIVGIIHITSLETDFLLDIEIQSGMQLETNGKPAPEDLYEAYKRAKIEWNGKVLNESQKRGFSLIRQYDLIPFENIESDLRDTIRIAYNEN
jgi:hypothetical protein